MICRWWFRRKRWLSENKTSSKLASSLPSACSSDSHWYSCSLTIEWIQIDSVLTSRRSQNTHVPENYVQRLLLDYQGNFGGLYWTASWLRLNFHFYWASQVAAFGCSLSYMADLIRLWVSQIHSKFINTFNILGHIDSCCKFIAIFRKFCWICHNHKFIVLLWICGRICANNCPITSWLRDM